MRQVSIIIGSCITVPNNIGDLVPVYQNPQLPNAAPAWPANVPQNTNFLYQPETLGNEFSVLRHVVSNQGVYAVDVKTRR